MLNKIIQWFGVSDNTRGKSYYTEAKMDIIIYSENEKDTGEKQQFLYAQQMLSKYNKYGVRAHLVMFKQATHFGETFQEYEKRLASETNRIETERVKHWAETDPDFYEEHIREIAKELGKIEFKKNPKKTPEEAKQAVKDL